MALAYFLINAKNNQQSSVAAKLVKMKKVEDIHLLYGMYDLIIKVKAKDMNDLHEFNNNELSNMKDIRSSAMLVVSDKTKEDNKL